MAIQKDIVLSQGVTISYHRITNISVCYGTSSGSVSVQLASYSSEQYRLDEKEKPGSSNMVCGTAVMIPMRDDDVYSRKNVYEAIMALPEWTGSTKV